MGLIQVVDELVSQPGRGAELHRLYISAYAPGAMARGMTLDRTMVSPPLWLDDGANRLLFLWTIADTAGFWRKNNLGRRNPQVTAIWARIDSLCASRRRDTFADPSDFARLADV